MAACRRIASLLSSATEILYGIGVGDRVVAVSHECDFPLEVGEKPRVTHTRVPVEAASRQIDEHVRAMAAKGEPLYQIDMAALAALRPDLIVTQVQCDVCAVKYSDVLEAVQREPLLRATAVVALNPRSLGDVLAAIRRLGQTLDETERAERFARQLEARVDAVRIRTAAVGLHRRPRVACIEWTDPLMIAGNWVPEMIDWAGGRQDLAEAGRHSGYTSWDDLLKFDPEVILVMPCGLSLQRAVAETRLLASRAGWNDITAVRRRQVHAVDGNALFNRAGPRLVDSLELLAALVEPDLFRALRGSGHLAGLWRQAL